MGSLVTAYKHAHKDINNLYCSQLGQLYHIYIYIYINVS